MKKLIFCIISIFIFDSTKSVMAQSPEGSTATATDGTIYESSFFDRYSPRTASDMVANVPGFSLSIDIGEVRGLGLGSGNLLINGKRQNTKDSDVLSLIPADKVLRIVLLTNGSIELPGQSGNIVNVITNDTTSLSGSWVLGLGRQEGGANNPSIEASIASNLGPVSITSGVNIFDRSFFRNISERTYQANGTLVELNDESVRSADEGVDININMNLIRDNGNQANLVLTGGDFESDLFSVSRRNLPTSNSSAEELDADENIRFNQVGNRYSLSADFITGPFKIIGLGRYDKSEDYSDFQVLSSEFPFRFTSDVTNIRTEKIFKALYSKESKTKNSFEFSLELVENTASVKSSFREDRGDGLTDVLLNGSNIEVNEDRAELYFQYFRPTLGSWLLKTLVATEYSKISLGSSDVEETSEGFTRYKGFISLGGGVTKRSRFRAKLERSVGQLGLFNFASVFRDISEGTIQSGNTKLVPPQTLRAELSLEYDFSEEDKFSVTSFRERIDDLIFIVPFEDGSEGLGNIDGVENYGAAVNGTFTTTRFGIKDGSLEFDVEWFESRVIDPVTGRVRNSGASTTHYQLGFRQDIMNTPLAWGFFLEKNDSETEFLVNEISTFDNSFPFSYGLSLEHNNFFGTSLQLNVDNIFGSAEEINRREFFENDLNGPLIEFREISNPIYWNMSLTISGSF